MATLPRMLCIKWQHFWSDSSVQSEAKVPLWQEASLGEVLEEEEDVVVEGGEGEGVVGVEEGEDVKTPFKRCKWKISHIWTNEY